MSPRAKRYFTQWAAQFYAAAELTRRDYLVSLTLGNAPESDLLVRSPSGNHFEVDVKGLSSRNFWLVQERQVRSDLYFILVHVPPSGASSIFFVLSSGELMAAIAESKRHTVAAGKPWKDTGSGINWGTGLAYQNRWEALPA